jgi:hypothetical protein
MVRRVMRKSASLDMECPHAEEARRAVSKHEGIDRYTILRDAR